MSSSTVLVGYLVPGRIYPIGLLELMNQRQAVGSGIVSWFMACLKPVKS